MKTTLSKIAFFVIGVMSLSVQAANTVDSQFTGTHVLAGDNNTVKGSPRPSTAGVSQVVVGINNNLTNTDSSQVFGSENILTNSDVTLTGQGNSAQGMYGNIYGDANTVNTGTAYANADVFGNGSVINGTNNVIMGSHSSITGANSTVTGFGNNSSGNYNTVSGTGNNVSGGDTNNVYGVNNNVTASPYSNVIGSENTVYDISTNNDSSTSDYSNVIGNKNKVATGPYSITIGNGNTNQGRDIDTGGISIGSNNTLTNAKDGTVIGNLSSAEGQNSLVFGSSAHATNGSVAIGSGSVGNRSNTVSFGNSGSERQLTNVAAGTADTDVTNVKQMRDGDSSTLSSARNYTDNLISSEQQARSNGDALTLNSAKGYTDARETVINSRVDNMLAKEKSDRITGDADTLALSGNYTDKQTAVAISTSNSYTDARENAINSRTDGLVADEASKRILGDDETLKTAKNYADDGDIRTLADANTYTNQRETFMNNRTDNLFSDERQARIDGDRNTLNSAKSYTNQKVHEVDNKVNRNERRANAGISAAMAMSSIPYLNYVSNSFGMASGTYRGETSVAAGLQSQVGALTNVRVNATWDTGGGVGVAAGMAIGW